MGNKTEYLIKRYMSNGSTMHWRVPKGTNLRLLLERLICQYLDDEALIASCLRKNCKGFYDPFQIMDMREGHRREQAVAAMNSDAESNDPIGAYNRARKAPIPLGKTLMTAGIGHEYTVTEVDVRQ